MIALVARLLLFLNLLVCTRGTKVFVSYAFHERGIKAERNLIFFLTHGVVPSASFDIAFGIVIKGKCTFQVCQNPSAYVQDQSYGKMITVLREDNFGFDFGAHTSMLNHLSREGREDYDYYIFLNCGVIGPILPAYIPASWHWASAFLDKMTTKVGLVGTSIACLPRKDRGGYGPKVEGFAFALSAHALHITRKFGTSFRQHKTKVDAILKGEAALTNTVMGHNIGIDCLLLAYQGIDWFNESNWNCNNNEYPSREKKYYGISINPLEVLFHKEWWRRKGSVMENYTDNYIMWNDKSLCRNLQNTKKSNLLSCM